MKVWQNYLQKLGDKERSLVLNVLKTAEKYAPDAEKAMPYGVPGLKVNRKPLIAVAAHKKHLGIYPFSPKIIEKIKHQFDAADVSEGTLRFPYGKSPSEKLVKQIVSQRLKEIS